MQERASERALYLPDSCLHLADSRVAPVICRQPEHDHECGDGIREQCGGQAECVEHPGIGPWKILRFDRLLGAEPSGADLVLRNLEHLDASLPPTERGRLNASLQAKAAAADRPAAHGRTVGDGLHGGSADPVFCAVAGL